MQIERNEQSGLYEATVGEHVYAFEKWGASKSLTTLMTIAKIVAGPAGEILGGLIAGSKGDFKKLLDMDWDKDMVADAIRDLMERAEEKTCLKLIQQFSSEGVFCDGAKVNFDLHYQDKLDHLYDVVQAGLEVQYGNFSSALRARLAAMAPKPKTAAAKPTMISNRAPATSTGTSGRRS